MSARADTALTLAELTRRAIQLLSRELGPADTARFIGQFSGGSGDYTAERGDLFAGLSLAQLAADIRSIAAPGSAQQQEPASEPPGAGG